MEMSMESKVKFKGTEMLIASALVLIGAFVAAEGSFWFAFMGCSMVFLGAVYLVLYCQAKYQ
jgi:hypothetical protein